LEKPGGVGVEHAVSDTRSMTPARVWTLPSAQLRRRVDTLLDFAALLRQGLFVTIALRGGAQATDL
jgi:hypothetical protein